LWWWKKLDKLLSESSKINAASAAKIERQRCTWNPSLCHAVWLKMPICTEYASQRFADMHLKLRLMERLHGSSEEKAPDGFAMHAIIDEEETPTSFLRRVRWYCRMLIIAAYMLFHAMHTIMTCL